MSNKIPRYLGGPAKRNKDKKTPFDLGEACGLVTANENQKEVIHMGNDSNSLRIQRGIANTT